MRTEFDERTRAHRQELLAHCYRMLASIHDAEDAVQETYRRARRAYDGFDGRSSLRTWLYKIATNACLRALENRGRRPLPTGLGGPSDEPAGHLDEWPELPWLEPIPDAMLGLGPGEPASDPSAAVSVRESVRLAFVAAIQHLPPRQRAVLLLRDVLAFSAGETADMLGTTTVAVNSLLQRARTQVERARLTAIGGSGPISPEQRDLLDRYVTAMHDYDIPGLVRTLVADAVWEMPPYPAWFRGAETIGRMVDAQCPAQGPGDHVLVPTAANGQPAFGLYLPDEHGVHRAFNLQVLDVDAGGISHIVAFFDPRLFSRFGLRDTLVTGSSPGGAAPFEERSDLGGQVPDDLSSHRC